MGKLYLNVFLYVEDSMPILKFDTFYRLRKGCLSYNHPITFYRETEWRGNSGEILTKSTFSEWAIHRVRTGKEQGKGANKTNRTNKTNKTDKGH